MQNNSDLEQQYSLILGKVLNYLSYGLRTEQEVSRRIDIYLNKKYIATENKPVLKQMVMERLHEFGSLDDTKALSGVISNLKLSTKLRSSHTLKRLLLKKGFDNDDVSVVLNDLSPDHDYACAQRDFEKKLRTTKDPIKLKKYLLSKGYSFDIISQLLTNVHQSL